MQYLCKRAHKTQNQVFSAPFCIVDKRLLRGYNYTMQNNVAPLKEDENKIEPRRKRVKGAAADIAECALFVALMTAAAYIRIPFPFVPLTFQTAVAILSGLLLGVKKGAVSMSAYAAAGIIGLPVFASGGGFSYVLMPSFGYILGFIAAATAAGAIVGGKNRPTLGRCLCASFSAFAINYAVGIAYFIAMWQLSGYGELLSSVALYNLIYMPKDAILSLLAAFVARSSIPLLRRSFRLK